jgi:hypothetical protein
MVNNGGKVTPLVNQYSYFCLDNHVCYGECR